MRIAVIFLYVSEIVKHSEMLSSQGYTDIIDKVGRYKAYLPHEVTANRRNTSLFLVRVIEAPPQPVIVIPAMKDSRLFDIVEYGLNNEDSIQSSEDSAVLVDSVIHRALIGMINDSLSYQRSYRSNIKSTNYRVVTVDNPLSESSNSKLISDTDLFISPPVDCKALNAMIREWITMEEYMMESRPNMRAEFLERTIRSYQDHL